MSSAALFCPSPPASARGGTRPPPALGPYDHLRLLHPASSRGAVLFSTALPSWVDTAVPAGLSADHAAAFAGRTDCYVSCQRFHGRRLRSRLAQLGCCSVDLDFYTRPEWAGREPEHVATEVLAALKTAGCPEPSLILASGRGLLAVWLHSALPPAALPRWSAVQSRLADLLHHFGPDRRALDPCRVFRLVGTRNSKSGAVVRLLHIAEGALQGRRIPFEILAEAVLPVSRPVLAQRKKAARNTAEGHRHKPAVILTRQSFYATMLADLLRLIEFRWPGGLPDGHRDPTLFHVAVAMAWVHPAAVLERELCDLAEMLAGWPPAKTRNKMSGVLGRARKTVAKSTVTRSDPAIAREPRPWWVRSAFRPRRCGKRTCACWSIGTWPASAGRSVNTGAAGPLASSPGRTTRRGRPRRRPKRRTWSWQPWPGLVRFRPWPASLAFRLRRQRSGCSAPESGDTVRHGKWWRSRAEAPGTPKEKQERKQGENKGQNMSGSATKAIGANSANIARRCSSRIRRGMPK